MTEPHNVIEKACLQLALTCMMSREPVPADEVRDLAAGFTAIAKNVVYEPLNRTPELVARAIRYLDNVHAIPLLRDNTEWFKHMLEAVVEASQSASSIDNNKRSRVVCSAGTLKELKRQVRRPLKTAPKRAFHGRKSAMPSGT